ncbi:hypothetical protein CEXT_325671 [Caerostris extrusa]|uniref:Uncharacterized protein n=1 Tax=Caerostris extrusa TaxID=172846 RepID=A0AAV4WNU5_CAEEX|nr:hypothetical protein CEXT_325671 [Caerostris extrusa]
MKRQFFFFFSPNDIFRTRPNSRHDLVPQKKSNLHSILDFSAVEVQLRRTTSGSGNTLVEPSFLPSARHGNSTTFSFATACRFQRSGGNTR